METDWRPALLLHIAAVPIWAWIVATPVLLYLAWLLPRLRRFQLMNRIPNPLPSKWLIGNTMELANLPRVRHSGKPDTLSLFISLSDRALSSGNGLFRLHFFRFIPFLSREWVFVADYQLAKELLSQDNYGNFDKGNFYRLASPLIGKGMLGAPDGHNWKRMRKTANPGFHPTMLRLAVAVAAETTMKMCERWDSSDENSETVDFEANMLDEMLRLTIDVLGRTAFSYDFQSVTHASAEKAPLFCAFDVILKNLANKGSAKKLVRNLLATYLFETADFKTERLKLDNAMAKLDGTVEDIISARQAEASNTAKNSEAQESPKDLLDFFVKNSESEKVTVDNIKTFLFAGHDTTASALSWALYLISTHPKVEAKLLLEFANNGLSAGDNSALTYEVLNQMPYLAAVVKEVLRLYPSAGFTRTVAKGRRVGVLGGYTLPEGVEIFVFPNTIQRDERNWPNALQFDPERWIGLDPSTSKGLAYLPFSLGPRNCVGMNLARMEIYTVLVLLLLRYNFTYTDPDEPQVLVYLSITPNRMMMKASRRHATETTNES